jgi:2'-5' RNA ligase
MDELRAALAAEAGTDCGAQPAGRITLMKSTLDPRGAIHTPLRHFELGT